MSQDKILNAVDLLQIEYIKSHLRQLLKKCTNYKFIEDLITEVLIKYNIIKNTEKFDNCELMNYVISELIKNIPNNKLKIIVQNIRICDNKDKELSIMDYIYRKQLFFLDCDLVSIFWNNKVKFIALNNYYITYIFEHYNKLLKKKNENNYEKIVVYKIIKSCNIIELSADSNSVINNLIHMFKSIEKSDYNKYKAIYMSFDEYDKFYDIHVHTKNIKYFMINILFFTMLEKINFKSLHKLIKTIIYNRELLSYLRAVLRNDPNTAKKYKNINEIAKDSIFISSEHQILLNEMIGIIFNFENSTTTIMNNNLKTTSVPKIIKINIE